MQEVSRDEEGEAPWQVKRERDAAREEVARLRIEVGSWRRKTMEANRSLAIVREKNRKLKGKP